MTKMQVIYWAALVILTLATWIVSTPTHKSPVAPTCGCGGAQDGGP